MNYQPSSLDPGSGIDTFKGRLRSAGQRVTPIRLSVMQALADSRVALDAAAVTQAVQKVQADGADRVSIYRTLNMLVETGLAHRIDPGDRTWRYQLTDHSHCHGDHHDHEHPHIVCDMCGSVQCLTDMVVRITPRHGDANATAFRVRQQEVTLHGICEACDKLPGRQRR